MVLCLKIGDNVQKLNPKGVNWIEIYKSEGFHSHIAHRYVYSNNFEDSRPTQKNPKLITRWC